MATNNNLTPPSLFKDPLAFPVVIKLREQRQSVFIREQAISLHSGLPDTNIWAYVGKRRLTFSKITQKERFDFPLSIR